MGSWKHLEGLGGELGYFTTACGRDRREEYSKKPHLMKKSLPVRVCRMAVEALEEVEDGKGLHTGRTFQQRICLQLPI